MKLRVTAWTAGLLMLAAATAVAQTRQEEARKKREEKSQALKPYTPPAVERGLLRLEEGGYIARFFNPPNGFFPQFGHLTPGAGLAIGGGYRANRIFGGHGDVLATASISNRRYFKAELTTRFPRLAGNRVFVAGTVHRSDFPEVIFHGLGPGSARGDRTSFTLRTTSVAGGGGLRVQPWLVVGQRFGYASPSVSRGRKDDIPSIEQLFDERTAPGLASQPAFLRADTYVDLDYRRPGPNARRGGHYVAEYSRVADRDRGAYSFDQWRVDVQQYVSILDSHRTFVFRGLMSSASPTEGGEVPFYLQPWLGGSHLLRSVPSFRFRDRSLLLLQVEYRWQVLSFLSGALFYDRATVAPDLASVVWKDMHDDYGFGLRFGGPAGVFVRTDFAFSGPEGNRFLLRFNNVF